MKHYFVFCHGWGFDHTFFTPLINEYFSKVPHRCLNLGYFGEKDIHLPDPEDAPLVGIGHSLGLVKLASLDIKFKALIGINAFINFLGFSPPLQRKRSSELKIMARHFQTDPAAALKTFYERCDALHPHTSHLDKASLIQDLELLTVTHPLPRIPLLILGATHDVITPPKLIHDNFGDKIKIVMHDKGHHNLGSCEHRFVYEQIMNFLNGLT